MKERGTAKLYEWVSVCVSRRMAEPTRRCKYPGPNLYSYCILQMKTKAYREAVITDHYHALARSMCHSSWRQTPRRRRGDDSWPGIKPVSFWLFLGNLYSSCRCLRSSKTTRRRVVAGVNKNKRTSIFGVAPEGRTRKRHSGGGYACPTRGWGPADRCPLLPETWEPEVWGCTSQVRCA